MNTKARLIVTLKCNRNCEYCCNKHGVIDQKVEIDSVEPLKDYGEVVITGGEPLLNVNRTVGIIRKLRKQNPKMKVFLHTAKLPSLEDFNSVLMEIDGLSYTVHEDASEEDIEDLTTVQVIAAFHQNHSFRLLVFRSVSDKVFLIPEVWDRIKIEDPMDDCPLPQGEDLFLLKE
jgi:MoaA/NifB/PqqE/SkfB family radical SAM enzyme